MLRWVSFPLTLEPGTCQRHIHAAQHSLNSQVSASRARAVVLFPKYIIENQPPRNNNQAQYRYVPTEPLINEEVRM